jgi:hypothetical protein
MQAANRVMLHSDFLLDSLSTLKTEVKCSSETSVDYQRITRRYKSIAEDRTLQNQRRESLRACAVNFVGGFRQGSYGMSVKGKK